MELLATGHVYGTFGVDGGIKVESCSGEYEHFFSLKKIYIVFQKNKLTGKKHKDGWFAVEKVEKFFDFALFRLEGVHVLEDAKMFVGADIFVERENASSLLEGEFYAFDLCSCLVFFEGVALGKILDVVTGGNGELLEVKKNDSAVCYIPFNSEFVGEVDLEQKKVHLKNSWILE